ncbi:MAG TPA: patatin-like phospholipase family protein [bacterium]|nr:patatin-like phospholipase family protein [bacterium]
MPLKSVIKPRIGLALGGGAARGMSHIGVIQVLEENGIEVHAIAGTSMGAIVGAIYLLEGNSRALVERLYNFFESDAFLAAEFDQLRERREEEQEGLLESMAGMIRRGLKYSLSVTRKSIISREVFENIIKEAVPDIRIENLPRPFACISLDVVSGNEVIWTSGSLRDALWSTSAIPGFFPPLELNGHVMVDGAWTNSVPVGPVRALGAERVIAVDISREVEEILEYKRGISLILRAALLTNKKLRELQLGNADLVLRPDVGDIHWADFSNPEGVIQKGRDAALVCLDRLRGLSAPPIRQGVMERVKSALATIKA